MHHMLARAQELKPFAVKVRRDLHTHPELGFKEVRTASIVANELRQSGYSVQEGVGKTGVVGILEGEKPGPCVMLRFDMDALPVQEETGAEYASIYPGVMHACGHDGHTAIGLTVARLLRENMASIHGTVKLVFQPAEEGLGGAEAMVIDGVLENPKPVAAFGLHLWNERPVGWAAVTDGPFMAGADMFRITISGTGGHGAIPQEVHDPIVAGAQLVTALQTIVARNVSPFDSAVVSVTAFNAGSSYNVIPPEVVLLGTVRSYKPRVRSRVVDRMNRLVEMVCSAMECQGEIEIVEFTPPVINQAEPAKVVETSISEIAPEVVIDREFKSSASEDMSIFLNAIGGCFFFLGSGPADEVKRYGHHHPKFDIDEDVLPLAAAILAHAAIKFLENQADQI